MATNDMKKCSRITTYLNRSLTSGLLSQLRDAGVADAHVAAGRTIMLQDKKGFLGLGAGTTAVVEDPVDIITLLVEKESENSVLNMIAAKGELSIPGRGTVFSEDVEIVRAHDICRPYSVKATAADVPMLSELVTICCIVQRGQGDIVGRVALDTGTCVPAITFGAGTGVRDKLGLLRITIPAEKEVVNFVTSVHDADAVMNLMVDAGKLDQPGKGFIYMTPVNKGLINTKITYGMPKHAASIEQMISALDELKGGVGWRRRSAGGGDEKDSRACLLDLTGFNLICNEGTGMDLVKAAMAAGAAGATISRQKYNCAPNSPLSKVSPSREACSMVVGGGQIPALIDALDKAGAFSDSAHGIVLTNPAPKACTYLGKK